MLIFVSGHHPILGTQMLYFLDPVLTARAELPPPTDFVTLDDGRKVPQKPFDRTRHVISKPEILAQDDANLTRGEQGFIEELELGKGA
jgi:hypothetical protein